MDISVFGLSTVAAITVLCYLVGAGVKTTPLDNKYIPVICGGTGLVPVSYTHLDVYKRQSLPRYGRLIYNSGKRPTYDIYPKCIE